MFTEWVNGHDFREYLIPAKEYRPFPKGKDRGEWEALDQEQRRGLVENAEGFLGFEWPSLPATAFLDYYRTGARVPYEKPHFTRRKALIDLTLGECAEGKGRFLDDIVNGIWAICEESFWGVSAHNGVSHPTAIEHYRRTPPLPDVEDPYIDLFAGETGALLAWCSYLLDESLDGVTPLIRRRVRVELERRVMLPFLNRWDFFWMGFTRKTLNWDPWIISNVMAVFLLEEHDDNRRAAAFIKMFDCLDNFMALYGPDGGCDEGTSYWNKAGGMLLDNLELLLTATKGRVDFFGEEIVRQIGRFMYREHIAGPYFINFADGAARVLLSAELLYRYGERIGDQKLMDLALAVPNLEPRQPNNSVRDNIWRKLAGLFMSGGYHGGKREGRGGFPCIRDTWLENIEVMAARQTEGSPDGLYLAAKGGHNGENHNHNDVGTFLVYVDGKPALIDVGVGVYRRETFSEERYSIWTMQSRYHNLPTLNGEAQSPGESFRARNATASLGEGATLLTLDVEGAYPEAAGVLLYRREASLIRGDSPRITVRDAYRFSRERNRLSLHLMLAQEPELEASAFTVRIDGDTSFRVAYTPGLVAEIEAIPTGDARLLAAWGETVYRVTLSAETGSEGEVEITVTKTKG